MTSALRRLATTAFRLAAFTAAHVTERPPAARAQPRQRWGRLIGLGLGGCLVGLSWKSVCGCGLGPQRIGVIPKLIHYWLLKRPRWHLHFTPTSASWLNLIEG